MPYIPLGSRTVTASKDTTGLNPGNYTSNFDSSVLNVKVPYSEVYFITVTGLATVQTITVYVNAQVRSTAMLLGNADNDFNQPILLNFGDDIAVCWDFGTGTAPTTTLWLRYDPLTDRVVR